MLAVGTFILAGTRNLLIPLSKGFTLGQVRVPESALTNSNTLASSESYVSSPFSNIHKFWPRGKGQRSKEAAWKKGPL